MIQPARPPTVPEDCWSHQLQPDSLRLAERLWWWRQPVLDARPYRHPLFATHRPGAVRSRPFVVFRLDTRENAHRSHWAPLLSPLLPPKFRIEVEFQADRTEQHALNGIAALAPDSYVQTGLIRQVRMAQGFSRLEPALPIGLLQPSESLRRSPEAGGRFRRFLGPGARKRL